MEFNYPPAADAYRKKVCAFLDQHLPAGWKGIGALNREEAAAFTDAWRETLRDNGFLAVNWPKEYGGQGLTSIEAAVISEEFARVGVPTVGPSDMFGISMLGNTLLAIGTEEQKKHYLPRVLSGEDLWCQGFSEPAAGSDLGNLGCRAVLDGDEWIINGHKWFISGADRAKFAILIARTEMDVPEGSRGANTAFIIDLPQLGWNNVREVETMHGPGGHSEIVIEDLRVHDSQILGGRGNGHRLGQYRLGPARLAHCMRWIAQAETALDMMVDRSLKRYSHGSFLAEKQGIQWLIADSAMEIYQCKLMILHAAFKIDRGDDFRTEVSMAKHFVANSLNRIIDRAIQVHGALGYSTDTPLANMMQHARWARFADGADEIHQMRIAENTIKAFTDHGTTRTATGDLPI